MPTSPNSIRRKLSISLASAAAFLLALELVLRVVGFRLPPPVPPIVIWNRDEDKHLDEKDELHERSPRQLWTPRAGANVKWGAAEHETINGDGYRGPALALAKTPGVLRIATFGDSSTFGFGVAWKDCYAARLPAELAARGVKAEVLDAGVIGFSIEQGFERYLELVRPYHPDVITLAFGAVNDHFPTPDLEDREKIAENARRAAERHPFVDGIRENVRIAHLAAWFVEKVQGFDRAKLVTELLKQKAEQKKLEPTMGNVDWPGKRRVSLVRFEEDLERFATTARADGSKVVLLSMPRADDWEKSSPVLVAYNAIVERVAKKLDAPLFDARSTMRAELEKGAGWNDLFVDAFHPSPKGHAIFAAHLAELIAPLAQR